MIEVLVTLSRTHGATACVPGERCGLPPLLLLLPKMPGIAAVFTTSAPAICARAKGLPHDNVEQDARLIR
jgi:hypothetical protein